jgi:hypothetical protein
MNDVPGEAWREEYLQDRLQTQDDSREKIRWIVPKQKTISGEPNF